MTTSQIEAFLAICQTRSITKAASMLYISQPTLSTRLRALETELGCILFSRQKGLRSLALTAEGRQFYDLALQYLEIVNRMRTLSTVRERGVLRVSSINSIGSCLLPPVCQRFLQGASQVRLELQDMNTEAAYQKLEAGETDLAFVTETRDIPGISGRPFFVEPMAFLCSVSAPYPDIVTRDALPAKQELFVPWCVQYIQWHAQEFGVDDPPLQLEIMPQLLAFLLAKPGWAIVPVTVARDFIRQSAGIRQCRLDFEVPPRTVYCLCRAAAKKQASFSSFLEQVCAELRKCAGDGVKILMPEPEPAPPVKAGQTAPPLVK